MKLILKVGFVAISKLSLIFSSLQLISSPRDGIGLPIIDNLENALSNLSENTTKEDKEGIELTLKSFESTLDKFGMIPIYPLNEEFNPEKHEAVSMEQDKNKKDGFVGNIFQRGWELHSRVLRPARVTVIKN